MSPEQAIASAGKGEVLPVYLLLGEERLLRDQVIDKLRGVVLEGAIAGLNDDDFQAGEVSVSAVIDAARTLPMMAKRRWVLVRQVERWEAKNKPAATTKTATKKSEGKADALDELAQYAQAPADSSVLVLVANSLNGRRRLVSHAKKQGFLVSCDPLQKNELPAWVRQAAKRRGCSITPAAADLITEIAGPDLSSLQDTVERLSLFVGDGAEITEDSVSQLLTVVRPATVWELVDALGRRDTSKALALLGKVYDPQDRGLRLLGVIGWSTRQLLRFQAARAQGMDSGAAAKAAGAPPFKARNMEQQAKRIPAAVLEQWLVALRDVDLALKGGSKRPPRAILEAAVVELCRQR